jgi:hypothetical protein
LLSLINGLFLSGFASGAPGSVFVEAAEAPRA